MLDDTKLEPSPRQQPSLWLGAILGAFTSVAAVALDFLAARLADLSFLPFDFFDWLARVLPGTVITIGIDSMVRLIQILGLGRISGTAKSMEQATGVLLVIAGGAFFGLVLAQIIRLTGRPGKQIGAGLGFIAFLLVAAMELWMAGGSLSHVFNSLVWFAILIVSWGALLGRWLATQTLLPARPEIGDADPLSRRDLLLKVAGGSAAVALAAFGLGKWLEMEQVASGAGQPLAGLGTPTPPGSNGPSAAPSASASSTLLPPETAQATVRDRVAPAPGTRPEVTANRDWYRTDIDTLPPIIDKTSWKMNVTGLFDRPRALTLSDLLAYPPVTQPVTMSCISNPVGGDLISSGTFVGVPLRDVLRDLGLRSQARALDIRAADGFYESVPLEELMDPRTCLVYGLNGETLPREHGFPLRIYIPNHYGMKQPKWITSIEAIDHDGPGYWVDRGWSSTAYPQIVSVIDAVGKDRLENGRVPIGGIAWAGDRGIKKVEVQVDNEAWQEALLRTPPLGPLTWVQWRYDWSPVLGGHTLRVRATDGTGKLQTERVQDTYPDGATGYHMIKIAL